MFELEVSSQPLRGDVSSAITSSLRDPDARISAISLFSWEEHCTECALPGCYTSCELYEARPDGRCRRFIEGFRPVRQAAVHQGYLVQVKFKQWASLFSYANTHLVPTRRAGRVEKLVYWIDRLVASLPDNRISIAGRRGPLKRLMRRLKSRLAQSGVLARRMRSERPSYLLLEIANPSDKPAKLSLTIRRHAKANQTPGPIPYQELLECKPGTNRFKTPYSLITEYVGDVSTMKISLTPNILSNADEGLTLYFGTLAFVRDEAYETESSPRAQIPKMDDPHNAESVRVKLVVWDLDNTLWEGTLVEDGSENLVLKEGMADLLGELDNRGILLSISSKNDPEPALARLKAFGIAEYFLFPKVSWGTKAQAIAELISDFNIGADTVAFVDDSPFEREQVSSVHPDVRVYDAAEYLGLADRPEFSPKITTDSSRRRYYYTKQQQRDKARVGFDGDYLKFLRECDIELDIWPGTQDRLDRMFELITRTNQLNFSGNRYSRDQIERFVMEEHQDSYCLDCRDKYGDYGMIGFGLVDRSNSRLVDMALSCRVQSKRIEHAFLEFLINRYSTRGEHTFEAMYRQTPRNQAAGAVFADLGFEVAEADGKDEYLYRYSNGNVAGQRIVTVKWQGDEGAAASSKKIVDKSSHCTV